MTYQEVFEWIDDNYDLDDYGSTEEMYDAIQSDWTGRNDFASIISLDDLLLSFNWIDIDKLKLAIKQTGVNIVYILGIDILKNVSNYGIYANNSKIEFDNMNEFKYYIKVILENIDGVSEVKML